ncbi:DUF5719 family protein [Isoptericola aurantiacus]|uniref:DUF5719 family protein n=1 Tax=Isoptericola aurantiacus TaxID=3377839 RepID=UPI00383B4E0F
MRLARLGRLAAVTATGLVAAGVLAATAAVGETWVDRWTGADRTAVGSGQQEVAVDPGEDVLVCPRPVRLPRGADVGDDQFGATPVETRSRLAAAISGASGAITLGRLDGSRRSDLAPGPDAAVTAGEAAGVRALRATPESGGTLGAAGAVSSRTATGDLRGLAAASCRRPATDHWLVGGDSEVGSSALLAVQNPSPRPAAVTLEVFGPAGAVPVGGQGTFTVAAGEQTVVRLDSLAPEQRRLAVHVTAVGARVTASLQTQGIDGLVPAGVDLVEPGAAPARSLAVTGVVSRGEDLDDEHAPVLWLVAPGQDAGSARVGVYGPDGPVRLRGAEEVDLEPGTVVGVPLGGLGAGTYTVTVDADVPVTAGARMSVPGTAPEKAVIEDTPYDVAWNAGRSLSDSGSSTSGQVALPDGGAGATVVLSAVPGADDRDPDADVVGEVTVTVRGLDAEGAVADEREVTVQAGTTVELPASDVGAQVAVVVEAPADAAAGPSLAWGVRLAGDDGTGDSGTLVATLDPTPALPSPGDVIVRRVDAS